MYIHRYLEFIIGLFCPQNFAALGLGHNHLHKATVQLQSYAQLDVQPDLLSP